MDYNWDVKEDERKSALRKLDYAYGVMRAKYEDAEDISTLGEPTALVMMTFEGALSIKCPGAEIWFDNGLMGEQLVDYGNSLVSDSKEEKEEVQ